MSLKFDEIPIKIWALFMNIQTKYLLFIDLYIKIF